MLALQRVPGLGDTLSKKLLNAVGSAQQIFSENPRSLLKIEGMGNMRIKGLKDKQVLSFAEQELKFIQEHNLEVHHFKGPSYPERLKQCLDAPILLFSKGNINLNNSRVLSIVGTRNATSYGVRFCERLIHELRAVNPIIVSGFAYGIDITAQKAAQRNGLQTIGCLAHGFNTIYPKKHRRYMPLIEDFGGFITEFWSDDPFDRKNFLKRNRIIAGMSEATVVIESAEKGGSLVTADIANSYHRDVFAVPGRSSDVQSKGCNHLIKSHQAQMITSASDLIYHLGWEQEKIKTTAQLSLFQNLSEEEHRIVKCIGNESRKHLDEISIKCELPTFRTAALLLDMELKGLVIPLPGKFFKINQ